MTTKAPAPHFETLAKDPTDPKKTFGQKLEELRNHSDEAIKQTAEKIFSLKDEIEEKFSSETFNQLTSAVTSYDAGEF